MPAGLVKSVCSAMQQRVSIRIGSQDPDELDRRVSVIVFSFYITRVPFLGGAQTTGVIHPLQLNTILNGQSLQILLRHE